MSLQHARHLLHVSIINDDKIDGDMIIIYIIIRKINSVYEFLDSQKTFFGHNPNKTRF